MLKTIYVLFSSALTIFSQSCHSSNKNSVQETTDSIRSDFAFQLIKKESYNLPSILDEISGITFLPNDDKFIYAIEDENGVIYKYDLAAKQVAEQYTFGKKGDYEDIATDGKYFYILKSNGTIYNVLINPNGETTVLEYKDLLPKGEYESLAFHPDEKKLYVLCKECQADKGENAISGYKLILENGQVQFESSFKIDLKKLKNLEKSIGKKMNVSAMVYHREEKQWYIISSIDKVIFTVDESFTPQTVKTFQRNEFEQPEGLAFDSNYQLYISSEIGKADNAFIYLIK